MNRSLQSLPSIARFSKLARALAVIAALAVVSCFAAAESAPAKTVKSSADVKRKWLVTNDGTNITVDWAYRFPDNGRCAKSSAFTLKTIRIFMTPISDDSFQNSGFPPGSKPFPIKKLGPHQYRIVFGNFQWVPLWNHDGTYAGSSPVFLWWNGIGAQSTFVSSATWDETRPDRLKGTVRWKKNGVKHVLKCEVGLGYDQGDDDAAFENADEWPWQVPSVHGGWCCNVAPDRVGALRREHGRVAEAR